jgi:5-methylcytosine-specific restriction endonuclease McrA
MNCINCNIEFEGKSKVAKYCSKQCKSKYEVKLRSNKPKLKTCQYCSNEFSPYTSLDKYCSANCRVENMKSKRSRRWSKESTQKRIGKNNPSFKSGMYARDNKRTDNGQKEYLRIRNEMRSNMILQHGYLFCEHCTTNQTYQWEMHHIIFRSEKPNHEHLHNSKNLINLCIKCHNWFHQNKSNRNKIVEDRKLYELFGEDVRNR